MKWLLLTFTVDTALLTRTMLPVNVAARTGHDGYPSLAGSYRSSGQHPRVLTTPADMNEIVTRINSSGSFSAESFARLSNKVKADLAANVDWDAVYSLVIWTSICTLFPMNPRPGMPTRFALQGSSVRPCM